MPPDRGLAAVLFGLVQQIVDPLQPLVQGLGRAVLGHAKTGRHRTRVGERLFMQRRQQGFRQSDGLRQRGFHRQNHKLLTTPAHENIAVPQALPHQCRQAGQHGVALRVTVFIVEVLEVVDIEHDERQRPVVALRATDLLVDDVQEIPPIKCAG
jgi:hypothetical protein